MGESASDPPVDAIVVEFKMNRTIMFVGDSFVEGVGDIVQGGWTRRVGHVLAKEGWNSIHKGVGGDNIRSMLNRLPEDLVSNVPYAVVVQVGINDSRVRPSLGNLNEVPMQEFSAALVTLQAIITRKKIARLFVMGLTPVDEKRTRPYKEDKIYLNRHVRRYEHIIGSFCRLKRHFFVPLFDRFVDAGGAAELTLDGLHPSPKGHELIAKLFEASFRGVFGIGTEP